MGQIKFRYMFRPYQLRILRETEEYLKDNKVHIVAAPGAGKTIIALELVFRLEQPALIFVPTIAIREQWIDKMLKDFDGTQEEDVSISLDDLKRFNVVTYQSLYEYKPDIIKDILIEKNIKTFVFDEAHHLRNAWFAHITKILSDMSDIKTISLTATPPYDDTKLFKNYIALCGEIDTSINAPELVEYHDLCPHQDYIYFNTITKEDGNSILKYRDKALNLTSSLIKDELFIRAIAMHRFIIDYSNNITEVISNDTAFFTMIKLLILNNITLPKELKKLKPKSLKLSIKELEALLTIVFLEKDEDFKIISKLCSKYKSAFTKIGAIYKGKINLLYSESISKNLIDNKGKLESINKIILNERNALKDNLKLVVITDYIKDYQSIDDESIDEIDSNQLGVIPIFNNIKSKIGDYVKPIVLTGSVVIIPAELKDELVLTCMSEKINIEKVVIKEFDVDFNYLKVDIGSNDKTVKVITKLFENSNATVLIGTSALIGEGWDAPFVNTLIIASNVSSYITSNQVRGRVIRTYSRDPLKVANIWHLVTLEQYNRKLIKGLDYERISTRLSHVEGLSLSKPEILSGIDRLEGAINPFLNQNTVEGLNKWAIRNSSNRFNIKSEWNKALVIYDNKSSELAISNECKKTISKNYSINNAKKYKKLFVSILGIALANRFFISQSSVMFNTNNIFLLACGICIINACFLTILEDVITNKKARLDMGSMCSAIIDSLKYKKLISAHLRVYINYKNGKAFVHLYDGRNLKRDIDEEKIIVKCIEEAFSDSHDTRYMIKTRHNTFNVPTLFDKTKETAELFLKFFKKHYNFRKAELIFSKGNAGKLERIKMLASGPNDNGFEIDYQDLMVDAKLLSDLLKD